MSSLITSEQYQANRIKIAEIPIPMPIWVITSLVFTSLA